MTTVVTGARIGVGPYGRIGISRQYFTDAARNRRGANAMSTTKQSTWGATLRTTILLASLSGLLVVIGALLGGPSMAGLFLGFALLINLGSYFFSDKLALKMSRAKPIEEAEAPRLYEIMRELTTRAGLPMPRLYMIPQDQPNAFATGRNPKHSAVAVTRGITKLLSEDELRGVLAHELTHVRNRDILIQSVASAIGAAITYLAYMLLWFGSDDESPLSLVASLAMVLLAPLAATIIQLAISRQREYAADAGGAEICGNPESLASALLRLEQGATDMPMQVNQAAEPLYIVKPFASKGIASLFSTHPPIEERVKRLRQMRPSLG
jgi:heat shock protein HtpX